MIKQLFLLSSIASLDAFLAPPSLHAPSCSTWQSQTLRHPSSPLHAEADADNSAAADEAPVEEETDILNSPAFLKRKEEVLKSDIAAMEKKIEETNAVYLEGKEEWGAKFDMLNKESKGMQDRLSKQGSQETETAKVEIAEKVLNVLENYDRAFAAVEAATNEEVEIVDAYKKSYDLILETFLELNVTKVETVGVEFDYENHQALMQMPSDEYEEGIVCQEFASGWRCGETLIRPAMVVVAA